MKTTTSDLVFSHVKDKAAFIDCLVESIWGTRRKRLLKLVSHLERRKIGSATSKYARAIDGRCEVIGNRFQQRYGLMRPFRRMPPVQLTMFSVHTPLTCAQAELMTNSLMRTGFRSQVSQVEMTFDLSNLSVGYFLRHLQSRARIRLIFKDSESGKIQTYYVGGRRSSWQIRIYRKTDAIVRLEFIFRRAFLRKHNINHPHELVLLRKLDLTRLVSLRKLDKKKLALLLEQVNGNWQDRLIDGWAQILTPAELANLLKSQNIVRPELFLPCRLEKKLKTMQRRLVW